MQERGEGATPLSPTLFDSSPIQTELQGPEETPSPPSSEVMSTPDPVEMIQSPPSNFPTEVLSRPTQASPISRFAQSSTPLTFRSGRLFPGSGPLVSRLNSGMENESKKFSRELELLGKGKKSRQKCYMSS